MREQVLAKLRAMLTQDFRVPPGALVEEADIRSDLWLDSVVIVDLYYVVQKDFGFEVDADEFRDVRTIGALADLIVRKTSR